MADMVFTLTISDAHVKRFKDAMDLHGPLPPDLNYQQYAKQLIKDFICDCIHQAEQVRITKIATTALGD